MEATWQLVQRDKLNHISTCNIALKQTSNLQTKFPTPQNCNVGQLCIWPGNTETAPKNA